MKLTKSLLAQLSNLLLRSDFLLRVFQIFLDEMLKKSETVFHKKNKMLFAVPNQMTKYRARTFSSKEPETLEWIDSFTENSVFWDIGANVGIYSIYAGLSKSSKVFAFEPSVFNLEFLARNINLNALQDQVTIVPIALSNKIGMNKFQMKNTSWGGALSTFGEDFDQYGKSFDSPLFEYSIPGSTIDAVGYYFGIDPPDYVKIDVDGIEHLILEGGGAILKNTKSILLEVNTNFEIQLNNINRIMKQLGFKLIRKCFMGDETFYNFWWERV